MGVDFYFMFDPTCMYMNSCPPCNSWMMGIHMMDMATRNKMNTLIVIMRNIIKYNPCYLPTIRSSLVSAFFLTSL